MSMNSYMHPRNPYRNPPDFTQLAVEYPEIGAIGKLDLNGKVRLDFQHPQTLRTLTASLLHRDFGLRVHLPAGKLVPTLPLRLNYILWLEDVLRCANDQQTAGTPMTVPPAVTGIDIGCGAACIYPLLAARTNNWRMYALEANAESVQHARDNVRTNLMSSRIEVVQQQHNDKSLRIFDTLLRVLAQNTPSPDPNFPSVPQPHRIADFCMCNPPFFTPTAVAAPPANRSGHRPAPRVRLACTTTAADPLDDHANGASVDELAVAGGELAFIGQIIAESCELRTRIRIYTTMCGHKSTVVAASRLLAASGVQNVARTEFCQGRTTRWALAWSFDAAVRLAEVPATGPTCGHRSAAATGSSKRKSFTFAIPRGVGVEAEADAARAPAPSLVVHQQHLEAILGDIGVQLSEKQHRSADLWLGKVVAPNAAWANQRRRRRELQRAAAQLLLKQQQQETVMDAQTAPSEHDDDESFYADEGWQQEQDEPVGKRVRLETDDGPEKAASTNVEAMLCVQLSILRNAPESSDFTLDMEFVSGSSGRDGAYQLMQFIQNRWK